MNLPTLKQLHYLLELERQQHFGKAAEACHVSQSTLSTAIQNLEELLGVVLLERDNRSLLFTPIGLDVVARSQQILLQTRELMEFAEASRSMFSGTLHVGCIPTISPFLLPQAMRLIKQQLPDLQVFLREDTSANLLNLLEKGELDLLILALPYDIGNNQRKVIGRDPFYLIHHQQRDIQAPIDYQAVPDGSILLLEETHCLRDHAVSACHLDLPNKINTFKANSLHTLVQMVNMDLGISFLPQMALQRGILQQTDVAATPFAVEGNFREIGLVWRPTCFKLQLFYRLSELLQSCLAVESGEPS